MSTTPFAATAGAARQRLAGSLGTLQQDPNVPPAILEIISGLARAMGPLFQLERGSTDTSLFGQARTVLQETLARMQTADQSYPGVADATAAIAESLRLIFQAMRDAGLVPPAPGAAAAPQVAPPQPAAAPQVAPPAPRVAPPAAAPAQPFGAAPARPQAPAAAPFAAAPQPQPQPAAAAPFASAPRPPPPAAAPFAPAPQPPPAAAPLAPAPQAKPPAPSPPASPSRPLTGPRAAVLSTPSASVPMGPNGLPRLEAEIGVHSETNFYTDFLGDIRNHGGIFVATFHVLPIGSQCEVLLTFPGNLTAELRGVVRWRRDNNASVNAGASPGLGIEITQAPPESWDLIDRFMRKREPIMHEM